MNNHPYQIPVESGHLRMPHPPVHRKKSKHWLTNILEFIGLFVFFFVLSSLVVMAPTIYSKISYYFFAPEIAQKNTNLGLPVSSPDYQTIAPQIEQPAVAITKESKIIIPKINVDAPLVFPQTADNNIILEAIKNGVAHYPGTAMPGQAGNVFLTGHSSYYWWSGGKYNTIFASLDKLQPNDLVYVYHDGKEYVYKVRDSIMVLPTQTEVLKPTTGAVLSLMTCVPVGTNLKRLIVRADLISSPPADTSKIDEFANIPKIPVFLPL